MISLYSVFLLTLMQCIHQRDALYLTLWFHPCFSDCTVFWSNHVSSLFCIYHVFLQMGTCTYLAGITLNASSTSLTSTWLSSLSFWSICLTSFGHTSYYDTVVFQIRCCLWTLSMSTFMTILAFNMKLISTHFNFPNFLKLII